MPELYAGIEAALLETDPTTKCDLTAALYRRWLEGDLTAFEQSLILPIDDAGRPDAPLLVDVAAQEFLLTVTGDKDRPVVLFSLEWCEFSWSVRKMFAHYGIPYRSIDLDSVAYQQGNRGGKIRAAIQAQTGLKTIPQIYIGGKHVGGATELFDAAKDGSMAELLRENRVSWTEAEDRDPYSFLPGWLHAR